MTKTAPTGNGVIVEWPGLDDCVDFELIGDPFSKCECGAEACNTPYHYNWCPKFKEGKDEIQGSPV